MGILIAQREKPQTGFKPYPDGSYDLNIDEQVQETNKKGNPQLKVKLTIMSGPYTSKPTTMWFQLGDKSVWRLEQLFMALGIEGKDTGQTTKEGEPVFEYEPTELVGAVLKADASAREYTTQDGTVKQTNEWNNFDISELDPEYATVIAARQASVAKGDKPANGVAQQQPAVAAAQAAPATPPPARRRRAQQ